MTGDIRKDVQELQYKNYTVPSFILNKTRVTYRLLCTIASFHAVLEEFCEWENCWCDLKGFEFGISEVAV